MSDPQLIEKPLPSFLWVRFPETKAFDFGELSIFAGKEQGRWHLSIAHPDRLPTWEEIKTLRDLLVPEDVFLAIPMPPKAHWVNLHEFCLHLWEHKDEELKRAQVSDGEAFREYQRTGRAPI